MFVVASLALQQVGAAISVLFFSQIGPAGMVTLRLFFAAVILWAVIRPTLRGRTRGDWFTVCAFGVVMAAMNILFYFALERVDLGVTLTLNLLGPLALAVILSPRATTFVWAGLALSGVALLCLRPTSLDALGAILALMSGAAWAAYILLSARTGHRFSGMDGLPFAMGIGALAIAPFGISTEGWALLTPAALAVGAVVALLASALPYALELHALRSLPPSTFSILLSLAPALGAFAGLLIIGQSLSFIDAIAISLVVLASMGVVRTTSRSDSLSVAPGGRRGVSWRRSKGSKNPE